MDFDELLAKILQLLQQEKRLSYRALKRRFALDDEYLEDVKAEIIQAKQLARDEDGAVLVWTGSGDTPPSPPPQPAPAEAQPARVAPSPVVPPTPDAERRQLTVLFCDLVDSTVLASRLDPEEWREVVRAYQDTCAKVIQRYEGHIAQYLGDGLHIYFGYPQAHEDDAQRAVRAGLGILDARGMLNTRLEQTQGIRLAVRIGIHTGPVVVGSMGSGGRHEQLALGETPNLAARLQSLAAPDTVAISDTTHRLVQGYFRGDDLGIHRLKGIETPVRVYRVVGESAAQSRLDVAEATGLTPLVGREQEVALLRGRWAQVKEGEGQVVLLSGEAGIGKSRLVQMVKEQVSSEPHVRWEYRCSPYAQNSPLYPVIDLMQRALQFQRDDAPETKLSKLEGALASYHVSLPDVVPLFAFLLSVPLSDRYPPLTLPPERQRQKTLEAVLAVLLAVAAQQPVLFIVEDLHWADPSTLELLSLFIDQGPTARILTLLSFRPEFRPPWGFRSHLTHITLARLPRPQARLMVERVVGSKALPAGILEQVVARTDGVPLFVEELTKMVLESGWLREREDRYELTGPVPPLAIPATLHDSLMARLDRLAPVKEVAQLGATLGRAFPYELLRAVSSLDEGTLQQALARLVEAELLYQRGVPPQATYLFKHALIQEAAYQSLLKSRRQQSHQRIAQVLAEQFPETAETQPELLAHHYTEAGLNEEAIGYWQRAGQRAIERSGHLEAISHLTKGLAVLKSLPDTLKHAQHELDLQTNLGPVLMATKGFTALEVEAAYARARELCRQVGDTPQLFPVLHGLWRFYNARGEFQSARELGEQLLALAQRVHDSALLLEAHRALGQTTFWLGELALSRAHMAQGMALYDVQQHRSHTLLYGQDPGVVCQSFAAWALWMLGYPDQARQRIDEALALAQELAHPFSLVYARTCAAIVHGFRREGQAIQKRAEEVMALAREQGFPFWVTWGTILQGWALATQRQWVAGITHLRQGLAAYQATGTEVFRPAYLVVLAEAHGNMGQTGEGLSVLAEALALVHRTGERWWEAELYRLKGELLLGRSVEDNLETETCFHQALHVARHQATKSLELRAAMSLCRLWQHQGRRAEARALLAPIYGWFTEGFDTADLQEAKALLEKLS